MDENGRISVERRDRIAVVTVDHPDKLNALNAHLVGELGRAFSELREDDDVAGIILTGAGEKAFVAGADIEELARMDAVGGVETSRSGQDVFRTIESSPKPVLAAVNGYALGGGCELALACHMRVAGENARFGLPEVGLGIIPGYGGTLRLARLVGLGRALQMILTGDPIGAEEAHRWGLANEVVPLDELLPRTEELLGKVLTKGPVAVRFALESVYRGLDVPTDEAHATEAHLFGLLAATEDMAEGMSAFMEKRKAEFRGK